MIKKCACFIILLLLSSQGFSQTVGTYSYKGKSYLVFPYRIGNTEEIPMMGYKVPDGEYIAFTVFNFKKNFSFKRKKTFYLTDTCIVAAIFNIKNNMTEGPAVFYEHHNSNKGKESKKPSREVKGNLMHNLKTGVWTTSIAGKKPYEYTTYINGLKEGPYSSYNNKGQISRKEHYCEGERCDSVFTFIHGKPESSYDLPDSDPVRDLSPYGKGLELLDINTIAAKTFYNEYDEKGKLIYGLKFNDGKILPYDSIRIPLDKRITYVTIKDAAQGEKRLRFVTDYGFEKTVKTEYYSTFLYRSVNETSYYKLKKNPSTGKKQLIQTFTYTNEETFIDPSTITYTTATPVLVEKDAWFSDTTKRYYIPKYYFAFIKDIDNSLAAIDTSRGVMLLNKQSYREKSKPYIRYESVCIPQEQQDLSVFQTSPYLAKAFIVCDERPDFIERYSRHQVELRDLETNVFYTIDRKSTYYINDTVLNGLYYFSPKAKYKHPSANIHYVKQEGFFPGFSENSFRVIGSGADNSFSKGSFVNGKKEGVWLLMKASPAPKKTPPDLSAYFFSHPKNCYDLREISYKNGMKDGLSNEYSRHNPKYGDDGGKHRPFVYKEKECYYTRDTLNGMYKEYYTNGHIEKDLHFVMGSPDGEYRQYDITGELSKLTHFNKGKLEGLFTAYRDGKVSCYANFKNNHLVDSLVYYSNGVRDIALYLKNDTLLKRACYYPDGKLKELVAFSGHSTYRITEHSISEDNYIETIKKSGEESMRNIQGFYRNYYDNGQLLSEGEIRDGELYGPWKFHAINGMLIHEVNFADTTIHLPNDTALTEIAGFYKGYYTTGAKRCTGYIKDLALSYDCFTKQDKAQLDFYALDFFDINGKQLLKNGNGYFINYDANGLRVAAGKVINCREDSLWKYYNPEQQLEETGNYVNHKKDGVWYEGSLEGINFEDGACFDMNNTEEVKAFETERKKLSISRIIYKSGYRLETIRFDSDLNKTYDTSMEFD
jgi:antitoxin component YwqK of YwqJK toxin-antitoxin module